jgi:hypothetical protein
MRHDIRSKFHADGTGFEEILRFYLNNLKCCNIGITDGNELLSTLLRCAQVV